MNSTLQVLPLKTCMVASNTMVPPHPKDVIRFKTIPDPFLVVNSINVENPYYPCIFEWMAGIIFVCEDHGVGMISWVYRVLTASHIIQSVVYTHHLVSKHAVIENDQFWAFFIQELVSISWPCWVMKSPKDMFLKFRIEILSHEPW